MIWRDVTDDHGAVLYSERPCGHYSVHPHYGCWHGYYDPSGQNLDTEFVGRANCLSAAKVLCREHLEALLTGSEHA